jgi:hypothetical protein
MGIIKDLAEVLRDKFKQSSVLLIDNKNGNTWMLNKNKSKENQPTEFSFEDYESVGNSY